MPRPSIFFAIVSGLVIAGCLSLISLFISSSVIEPNPFAIMGGMLFLPLTALLAVQQYRGTFRRVPRAANAAGMLLYIFAALVVFGLVVSAGEAITEGVSLGLMGGLLSVMAIVAGCSAAIGWMNMSWEKTIRSAIEAGEYELARRSVSLRELLIWVGVFAAMFGMTAYAIRTAPPRVAEHVDAEHAPVDLPSGATDISYALGVRGMKWYEFTVSEQAFRDWVKSGIGSIEAESSGVQLQEITSPCTMDRYLTYGGQHQGPDEATITDGLYYEWWKEDRGVYAAFDRATGRAYFHAHYH